MTDPNLLAPLTVFLVVGAILLAAWRINRTPKTAAGPIEINAVDLVPPHVVAAAAMQGLMANPLNAENPLNSASMAWECVDVFYEGMARYYAIQRAQAGIDQAPDALAAYRDLVAKQVYAASAEGVAEHRASIEKSRPNGAAFPDSG